MKPLTYAVDTWPKVIALFLFSVCAGAGTAWLIAGDIQYTAYGSIQSRLVTTMVIAMPWMVGVIYLLNKAFVLASFIRKVFARRKQPCNHEKYQENMACHGICLSCGEDLGFVQPLRESNPKGETGFQDWDCNIEIKEP